MEYVIGVDIGGTKIASIVVDSGGNIVQRCELPSIKGDSEEMFQQVADCIHQLMLLANISMQEVTVMGVGIPGKVDREKGVAVFQNNLPWRDFPIVERLQEQFPLIQDIAIDNDVYMAAYAEWELAKLPQDSMFVYVTVSTGISCSIIQNGKFLRGNGFAGELGLLPIEKKKTLEDIASGPAILRSAREVYNDSKMDIETLFLKYKNNEKKAVKIINSMLESLAKGIYSIICLIHPHQIVCGGGVINHQPYIVDLLNKLISQYMISGQQEADNNNSVKISRLKEDAGVVGASKNITNNVSALNQRR
ncbi:ROK family protein [Oceanobacillus jeddahense]|uniref:ROK family protein n=1 Tax=Oceanobacillus jeddahense TaxID=1462527 RepID=A0ABY5JRE0_9BACI|nr:ROK family protein [Oceanobacillus jeddahense]UUI02344.1 ROK family protein [Oceanobacillus jeddahense]